MTAGDHCERLAILETWVWPPGRRLWPLSLYHAHLQVWLLLFAFACSFNLCCWKKHSDLAGVGAFVNGYTLCSPTNVNIPLCPLHTTATCT